MKLSQLISKYHSVCFSIRERDVENDPLGGEADDLLVRIERTRPCDTDDVIALAHFARHIIEAEQDPYGALPLLKNIATWASAIGENSMDTESCNLLLRLGIEPVRH